MTANLYRFLKTGDRIYMIFNKFIFPNFLKLQNILTCFRWVSSENKKKSNIYYKDKCFIINFKLFWKHIFYTLKDLEQESLKEQNLHSSSYNDNMYIKLTIVNTGKWALIWNTYVMFTFLPSFELLYLALWCYGGTKTRSL